MTARYLADTSAWNRSGTSAVRERWAEWILRGMVALCSPVRLELLYSARSPDDYIALDSAFARLPELALDSRSVERAHIVQRTLSSQSQHRAASPIDLYIAAVAELNGVTLLHYDRHFDAVVDVTGQATEWIAPRGSLD